MAKKFKVTVEFLVTAEDDIFDTNDEFVKDIRDTIQDGLKLPGYMITNGMSVEMFTPVKVAAA